LTNHRPEPDLILAISTRENFEKFQPFIKDHVIVPEALAVIEDIGEWFKANPDAVTVDWAGFLAWSRIARHPLWKPDRWEVYVRIVETAIKIAKPNPGLLERLHELDILTRVREQVDQGFAAGGTGAVQKIVEVVQAVEATEDADALVTDDLEALLDAVIRKDGINWRLPELNLSLGPVHPGDSIMIVSRPEVGKTTFLTSELTHMLPQLAPDRHGIIFNNEERGQKVKLRVVQSALNLTLPDLAAEGATSVRPKLSTILGGRRLDVHHDTALTKMQVERRLRAVPYGLVGLNVLDKIGGFGKLEGWERVREVGLWARTIADKYNCTVFGTLQADSTAEGQRYLNQSQVFGSKTGMQAESDVLVMIGQDLSPGLRDRRFLSIARNKLPGGPETKEAFRHGQFEVGFDGERGRFHTLTRSAA